MRILIAATLCLVVTAMFAVAEENLCPNPGFERAAESGNRPAGWVNENGGGTWATDEVHSGERSVKISSQKERTRMWTSNIIPVESDQRLILSVWAKLEDVGGNRGAAMVLYHMDENGERIGQSATLLLGGAGGRQGTKDWARYFAASEFTSDVKGVRVNVRLYRATGAAWFDDVTLRAVRHEPIAQAVPLRRGIDLGRDVAVVAAEGAGEAAEDIHRALTEAGAETRIVDHSAVNLRAEDRELIILGNLANSDAIEYLNRRYYTFEDLYFPGPGGFVLRPLVNPLGTGANMLVVGASDDEGLRIGANRLVDLIANADGVVECELTVEIGEGYRAHNKFPWPASPPWDEIKYAADYLKSGDMDHARRYREYVLNNWFDPNHREWRHLFYITKTLSWELMHTCAVFSNQERLRITNELLEHMRGDQGYGYGGLDSADGMIKENHATRAARAFYFGWRHFDKYYPDNLPAELQMWRRKLRDFWTLCFSTFRSREDSLSQHALGGSMDNTVDISFMEPEWSEDFWSSDRPELMGRRCIIISNNMGQTVMLGDTTAKDYATSIYSRLAYALGDGRYQFMIDKRGNMVTSTDEPMRGFNVGVEPVVPEDQIGLSVCPGDPLYFRTEIDYRMGVSAEEGFDKLAFRSSFDPDDEYLMLDGVSCGTHSYDDVNTIGEFSDNGRRWLIEIDRLKGPSMAFHNGVTVARDGLGAKKRGEAARLLAAEEGEGWAYTATAVPRYNGCTWNRHILWLSGDYFYVIDEMTATEPGDYSFVLAWRSLGQPELSDGVFTAEQDAPQRTGVYLDGREIAAGATAEADTPVYYTDSWGGVFARTEEIGEHVDVRFEIPGANEYRVRLSTGDISGRGIMQVSVDGEPIGEPVDMYARSLTFSEHDLGSVHLDEGSHTLRFTVVGQNENSGGYMLGIRNIHFVPEGQAETTEGGPNRFWQHFPASQSATVKRDYELLGPDLPHNPHAEQALNVMEQSLNRQLGSGESASFQNMFYARTDRTTPEFEYRRLNESCALVRSRDDVALLGASVGGAEAEIGRLRASGRMFYIGPRGVINHEASLTFDGETIADGDTCSGAVMATLLREWDGAGTTVAQQQPAWEAPSLNSAWQTRLPARPRSAIVRKPGESAAVDVGLDDGSILEFDPSGAQTAGFSTGGPVHVLQSADIREDGSANLIAGSDDETLYVLGNGLEEIWRKALPFVRFDGMPGHWTLGSAKVRGLAADDLTGDGRPEIIAGTGSMHVHCLDADGEELWRTPVTTGARWTYGIPDAIRTADVFGDGPCVLIGNGLKSYSAWCTVLDETGAIQQQYKNGGWAITCPAIAVGDLDHNGEKEVFCGNNLGDVRSFRGSRETRLQNWWHNLSRVIRSLTVLPQGDGAILAVGSDSGYLCTFDAAGNRVWGMPLSSAIIQTAVVHSDNGSMLAAGCADGRIFLCSGDGRLVGMFDCGGPLQAMSIGDVDGDGADEIVAASASPDRLSVIQAR